MSEKIRQYFCVHIMVARATTGEKLFSSDVGSHDGDLFRDWQIGSYGC